MKRTQNRKETVRRERVIMLLSSAFVLAALVCVGLYMRGKTTQEQDDGYQVDFAKLESSVVDNTPDLAKVGPNLSDDEMDYMPREDVLEEGLYMQEADSGKVEIGKLKKDIEKLVDEMESMEVPNLIGVDIIPQEEVIIEEPVLQQPAFTEISGLFMPVEGEVLMHYNMDHTVYFATLDQYKYNPATIIGAAEGSPVYACADATVKAVYSNEEIGNALVLDLGNGYEVIYGQVKDVLYKEGDRVTRGNLIAAVAAPTKYYSVEGCNLYFAMKKDGEAKSAEALLPIE